jgi:hypothetical protein
VVMTAAVVVLEPIFEADMELYLKVGDGMKG